MFLDDRMLKPDSEQFQAIKEVYADYRSFCFEDGYKPLGKKNFIRRLESLGVLIERKAVGMVAYIVINSHHE